MSFVVTRATAVVLSATAASAQEPPNAPSATLPSPGQVTTIHRFRWTPLSLDSGPRERRRDITDAIIQNNINVGLFPEVSLSLSNPIAFRREEYDNGDYRSPEGFGDLTALVKWRFWRNDVNALDTQRLALLAGCEIRSGDFPFTNDSYNPILGLAYTQISGRHGVNAAAVWNFTTDGTDDGVWPGMSDADLFRWDLAYLFRVDPVEYSADTAGAWYALCELNGLYETNGDAELFIAPGLMYEAARWTLELSVQVPVWQSLDYRPAAEYSLMMGLRFAW